MSTTTNLGLTLLDSGLRQPEVPINANYELIDAAIGDLQDAGTLPAFTAPTLLNSWANFGLGFNVAGYYKMNGRVYLRGLVKLGTMGAAIFTLPAGYRPVATELHVVISNNAIGRVDIDTSGNVIAGGGPSIGNNAFIALDGISFVHV